MLYVLFRSHPVQNWVCSKITNYLSQELNTTVSVRNVDYELFTIVTLEHLYIEDLKHDTLLYARDFRFKVNGINLDKHILSFKYLDFFAARVKLAYHKNESKLNYKFIEYYFSPPDRVIDTTVVRKPWTVEVGGIVLHDSKISYSNENRPRRKSKAFDPNYIVFMISIQRQPA